MRKEFVLDGNKFDDLEGFYCEIDKLFTKNLSWKTGHNLDALNDLLRGGFGVHEYGEPIAIKWINFNKSKKDFCYGATENYYKRMLQTCHPSNRDSVNEKLLHAKLHKGKTILDLIIEVILHDENSGHDCKLIIEE